MPPSPRTTAAQRADRFRASGRRLTPQRRAVFAALERGPDHVTAEQVHRLVLESVEGVSLKTVYQTLHELTELGQLVAIDVGTGSLRFDDNLEPHHHLVCGRCGAIVDVAADLTQIRTHGVDDLGVRIDRVELVMRGRCRDCAAEPDAH